MQKVKQLTSMSKPIAACGFLVGLFLSVGVLSGDAQGRVNLLYLLLVFMVLPVFGAMVSVFSLFTSKRINGAQLLLSLPVWPNSISSYLHKLHQNKLDKQWLFLQSQIAALAYSIATLVGFICLLLITDINFVWRSTLINAEQLYDALRLIATPWTFWEAAQPSLELLYATQDSRLSNEYFNVAEYGKWWPFIIALLLVYAFALRGVLYVFGVWSIRRATRAIPSTANIINGSTNQKLQPEQHKLATVIHELNINSVLANWAKFSRDALSTLPFAITDCVDVGPELEEDDLSRIFTTYKSQLLIVKSWEPPMGELEDYMAQCAGLIFPVDMTGHVLSAPTENHLQEWQRFVEKTPGWQLFQPLQWHSDK